VFKARGVLRIATLLASGKALAPNSFSRKRARCWLLEYIEYQGETDGDDKTPHDGLPSEYQLTCSSLPSLPDKDAPFHRAIQRLGAITSQPVFGLLQNLIFGTHSRINSAT
jgi:hypothetical protein